MRGLFAVQGFGETQPDQTPQANEETAGQNGSWLSNSRQINRLHPFNE